ncbi:hypothetical protein L6452_43963 [Arctium lappa]|uniref:Uncharacterized protein n=1 Tax=Arctium lappa TaxID=4217 RepID=A0ACB8XDZ7_ARCLA|nr:hypothetical protein L6452_43963 [Arctium lappa]
MELLGFKCCQCRRIRIPFCPYMDPETRWKLESKKKPVFKKKKLKNSEPVSNRETINVQDDDSLSFSPMVDPVNDRNIEASGAGVDPYPGFVPKKLQVRRQIKLEKESDGCSENVEPPTLNNPNPGMESSSPIVEWNVSTNGFEDDIMFDYEDLNYEIMNLLN